MTPEERAELRRLMDAATPAPWAACEDDFDVIVVLDDANNRWPSSYSQIAGGWRQGDDEGLTDAMFVAEMRNAFPALLDAADRLAQVGAERDALAAKVERVRALHYAADNDVARTPICETCHGKAGVHECGCWAERDREPMCGHCREGHKGMSVAWPCPTIRALDGADS